MRWYCAAHHITKERQLKVYEGRFARTLRFSNRGCIEKWKIMTATVKIPNISNANLRRR